MRGTHWAHLPPPAFVNSLQTHDQIGNRAFGERLGTLAAACADRHTRDFTRSALRRALAEVLVSFPVYRTYIVDKPSPQDRRFIDWAIGRARLRNVDADADAFDFIRRVLLGKPLPRAPADLAERYRVFARRLQQYTAPVGAKGVEDTALYRHQGLVSVNDVGGEPDAFGMSVAAFHAASLDRALHWPDTMLATSTHDAKRSEDVRARIDVSSEMPAAWRLAVRRWSRLNRSHKRVVDGVRAPSRNVEYVQYQLLLGSLPHGELDDTALADCAARIEAVMLKSARESNALTSWMNPNEPYESALAAFVQALFGRLSLVDPDNRRPVDFARRRALLAKAQALWQRPDRSAGLRELLARVVDGDANFWVTWRALQLKREFGPAPARADYLPLEVHGQHAAHVVAFARRAGPRWVVVVGTRLSVALGQGAAPVGAVWGDTAIVWPPVGPEVPRRLDDAISGQRIVVSGDALPLAEALREFPVAALFGDATPADDTTR